MKDILKQYWWAVAIIILAPIVLNCVLQIPAFVRIVGDNTDWLTFFGSYFGGIISTLTAMFVLFKTLQQNHDENEHNRTANEEANEKNRKLQLNILSYQQEQDWLNQFRKIAAEYVALFSYNDLVDVANVARKDPHKAFYLVKDLFTRAGKADLNLAFIQRESDLFQKLSQDKTTLFVFYNQVVNESQTLLSIRITNPKMSLKRELNTVTELSDDMMDIINRAIAEYPNATIADQFNTVIMARIKIIEKCEEKLRDWFCEYIQREQLRINNILYTHNGTEQTK